MKNRCIFSVASYSFLYVWHTDFDRMFSPKLIQSNADGSKLLHIEYFLLLLINVSYYIFEDWFRILIWTIFHYIPFHLILFHLILFYQKRGFWYILHLVGIFAEYWLTVVISVDLYRNVIFFLLKYNFFLKVCIQSDKRRIHRVSHRLARPGNGRCYFFTSFFYSSSI